MKKLLFLLLCTVSMYGQTLQNPTYGTVKLKQNTTDLAAEKVSVQSVDGSLNTIAKTDLINVVEVVNYAGLPTTGAIEKLYVTKDTNKLYRWNGSTYVDVAYVDVSGKEDKSNKGIINGYASLDGSGKVPLTQINEALLGAVNYKGTYNATTNTPALATVSSSNKGWYYIVSVDGTQQSLNLKAGDWVISNGVKWDKVDNNNNVTNVFGRVGAVTAQSGDYTVSQVTNAESNLNKKTTIVSSDTDYPTSKAVIDYVATSAPVTPDATTTVKGKIKLAGDLGGTADLPTVPKLNAEGLLKYDSASKTIWNNGFGNVVSATSFGDGAGKLATGNFWLANGYQAGYSNTTGSSWTAIGSQTGLSSNGSRWTAVGSQAGYSNTTGNDWTAEGYQAGYKNTTGSGWLANGYQAGHKNITGNNWTAIGNKSANLAIYGNDWVAIGSNAGRYISQLNVPLETLNNSIFLGAETKALLDNSDNEIVIGYNAIGAGSNTATLGNTSVTKTVLRGEVNGGSFVKSGAPTTNIMLAGGGDVAHDGFLKTTGNQIKNGSMQFNDLVGVKNANIIPTTGNGLSVNTSYNTVGIYTTNNGTNKGYIGVSSTGDNMLLEGRGAFSNYIASQSSDGTGFNFVGQNAGANTYTVNKTGDVVAKSVTINGNSVISGTGTVNFLPKFTSSGIVSTSAISDNGSIIILGRQTFTDSIRPNTGETLTLLGGGANNLIVNGLASFTNNVTATQFRVSALNTAPASATATGITGEIRVTSTHIYVCTATNTWVRTALTTW